MFMTLKDLLLKVTHQNYKVVLQQISELPITFEIPKERLSDYLDYQVIGVSENWVITLKGAKIV